LRPLEFVLDLLAEIGRVEVLLLGCAQFPGECIEVCSPAAHGAPEGEDRLQCAGFGRQMSIMVCNRLRTAGLGLLFAWQMPSEILLDLAKMFACLADDRRQGAFAFGELRQALKAVLGLATLPDQGIDPLLGLSEVVAGLRPGLAGIVAITPSRQSCWPKRRPSRIR
jgi:hypothetical protein